MNLAHDHEIHSANGRLNGAGRTSEADARRIAAQAWAAALASPVGAALHFHGGLVNTNTANDIRDRLGPRYIGAGAYPIFYKWESGFIEAIRNNLNDILKDSVFRELVKKVAEWALKEGVGDIVTRGGGQSINRAALKADFDRWFEGAEPTPPVSDRQGEGLRTTTRAAEPDEEDLALKIEAELETDEQFERTLAGLAVAANRVSATTTRGAGIEPAPVAVLVDAAALDQLFPPLPSGTTRGGIAWLKVAKFVAKVVIAVLRRMRKGRDHGGYTTVVEEVLRAAYLAKVGEVLWRTMKKDTADAFGVADGAGEVVLAEWARLATGAAALPRVTLIGHSTGAIYINHWIRRSAALIPQLGYDVVFLAPACTFDDFGSVLQTHPQYVRRFRSFCMRDDLEQQDRLVPVVYPRSLLYFVSGVVEGGEDVPILGMRRYIDNTQTFDPAGFPHVGAIRSFLAQDATRAVNSITDDGPGRKSASTKHGDFDNDVDTMDSLGAILNQGF